MRPRQAFGQQPGRLAATMLRALSAELSDPARYARGKAYARDGAVIDIEVRPGEVAGQVLGSRRDAYRVSLFADPAPERGRTGESVSNAANVVALIPDRTELSVECTCPDAGGLLCKHAIAVLLVYADEVSIEPDLLSRWRGEQDRESGDHVRPRPHEAPRVDVLAPMLSSPAPLPPPPILRSLAAKAATTPRAARTADTDLLDQLLAEALAVIRR